MINDTCTFESDPLIGLYEQVLTNVSHNVITERENVQSSVDPEQFKVRVVKIYVKRGDENPQLMYRANVTDYDERDVLTTITSETDDDRRIIIKKTPDDNIDVTVLDQNNNMQDEFNIHGMQFQDIDNPDVMSILKIEQI